jgi:hypothetical protein
MSVLCCGGRGGSHSLTTAAAAAAHLATPQHDTADTADTTPRTQTHTHTRQTNAPQPHAHWHTQTHLFTPPNTPPAFFTHPCRCCSCPCMSLAHAPTRTHTHTCSCWMSCCGRGLSWTSLAALSMILNLVSPRGTAPSCSRASCSRRWCRSQTRCVRCAAGGVWWQDAQHGEEHACPVLHQLY